MLLASRSGHSTRGLRFGQRSCPETVNCSRPRPRPKTQPWEKQIHPNPGPQMSTLMGGGRT